MTRSPQAIYEHIVSRSTVDANGCWLWQGATNSRGYGQARANGVTVYVHRFVFERVTGEGLGSDDRIDHTCHNDDDACQAGVRCPHRRCINPAHLVKATHVENVHRGRLGDVRRAGRCRNGHRSEHFRLRSNGRWECGACAKERAQRWRDARK